VLTFAITSFVYLFRLIPIIDIVKKIFEGTLRSVLICEECGNRRSLTEPFLSVSLPLSKEVERRDSVGGKRGSYGKIPFSVESCLQHFTSLERLSDPVDCPSCQKKTPTKKQHTFSKLPKVLCLHLKRFDAAQNKKIDDFVSFPARELNLGVFLPHW
jgi:ubiquitin C-terminal hydrolase